MQLSLLLSSEHSSGLADVRGARSTPRDRCGVLLVENLDLTAVHDEKLLPVGDLCRDLAWKPLVDAVVLQLVDHVGQFHERIIDGLDLDLRVGQSRPSDEATDAAKAVD